MTTNEPKIHKGNLMRKVRAQLAKASKPDTPPADAAAAMTIAQQIVRQYALEGVGVWPQPPAGYHWKGGEVVEIGSKPRTKPARKPKAERKPRKAKALKAPRAARSKATNDSRLEAMLRTDDGATLDEVIAEFQVQPHTARAMISMLGKKLGHRAKRGEDKRYRMPAA